LRDPGLEIYSDIFEKKYLKKALVIRFSLKIDIAKSIFLTVKIMIFSSCRYRPLPSRYLRFTVFGQGYQKSIIVTLPSLTVSQRRSPSFTVHCLPTTSTIVFTLTVNHRPSSFITAYHHFSPSPYLTVQHH
jgi:hypothetical protein